MRTVDLNCDLGESFGGEMIDHDAALMDHVSSVNIACGRHAGDETTMRLTVEAAAIRGLAIGAHPGYADIENFGRREMDLSPEAVYTLVREQVELMMTVCREQGARLRHVKPHGALYNQAARDARLARAIAEAVRDIDPELMIYGLSGSRSISEAEAAGLSAASEVFADRTYQADGSLTPRSMPNALIDDPEEAIRRAVSMVVDGRAFTPDGEAVEIAADTICIHGDGPHALEFARAIRAAFDARGIEVSPPGSR
jgi:5-oxoprolinase (ATP-hydrolysing) subunit A